jgi:hypothetical protein
MEFFKLPTSRVIQLRSQRNAPLPPHRFNRKPDFFARGTRVVA